MSAPPRATKGTVKHAEPGELPQRPQRARPGSPGHLDKYPCRRLLPSASGIGSDRSNPRRRRQRLPCAAVTGSACRHGENAASAGLPFGPRGSTMPPRGRTADRQRPEHAGRLITTVSAGAATAHA